MSTKYKHPKEVPLQVIVARLRELATAITKGRDSQEREFTMSIPAERDRDADIVINEAANRIGALQSQVAELEAANSNDWIKCSERLPVDGDGHIWIFDDRGRLVLGPYEWDMLEPDMGETHWMPTGLVMPDMPKQEPGK